MNKLSIRSKILVKLGKAIYGTPYSWGLDCSAEEFYAMPSERSIVQTVYLNPKSVGTQVSMKRNLKIDIMRRAVFKNMCIASSSLALAVFISTNGTSLLYNQGKMVYKNTSSYISGIYKRMNMTDDERLVLDESELQAKINKLTSQWENEKITESQFIEEVTPLNDKYKVVKAELDSKNKIKVEAEKAIQDKVLAEEKIKEEARLKAEQVAKAASDEQARLLAEQKASQAAVEPTPVAVQPVAIEAPKQVDVEPVSKPIVVAPKLVVNVVPQKPRVSEAEKASKKEALMSQFQNGQITREEMLDGMRKVNSQ